MRLSYILYIYMFRLCFSWLYSSHIWGHSEYTTKDDEWFPTALKGDNGTHNTSPQSDNERIDYIPHSGS